MADQSKVQKKKEFDHSSCFSLSFLPRKGQGEQDLFLSLRSVFNQKGLSVSAQERDAGVPSLAHWWAASSSLAMPIHWQRMDGFSQGPLSSVDQRTPCSWDLKRDADLCRLLIAGRPRSTLQLGV